MYNITISFVMFEGLLSINDPNGFDPITISVKIVVNRIVNMRGNRYCAHTTRYCVQGTQHVCIFLIYREI